MILQMIMNQMLKVRASENIHFCLCALLIGLCVIFNFFDVLEENTQVLAKDKSTGLPYREPEWSGLPESSGKGYSFDVLKNGSIIESVDLMKRPFWVFGRLEGNHICMQHPTISRYLTCNTAFIFYVSTSKLHNRKKIRVLIL